MSLVKTFAKVAIGVAAAKGVHSMVSSRSGSRRASGESSGGLLGSVLGGSGGSSGGLGGVLERLGGSRGGSGGLSGILKNLAGGSSGSAKGGGLAGALGGLASGSGGLGGLLGGLAGGSGSDHGAGRAMGGRPGANDRTFGEVLNSASPDNDETEIEPTPEQEMAAALLLRAMIQAAMADGRLDEAEKARLLDKLDDASEEEIEFVRSEIHAPIDVEGLAADTPEGMEPQLYAMSVMAIDIDTEDEVHYLRDLANALKLRSGEVSHIHEELGAPPPRK